MKRRNEVHILCFERKGYETVNNIDTLFHEFLCFISKWKSGETPDKKQYYKQKVYYNLWDHFHNWFLDGICPSAMQVNLEYEKWKLLNNGLTDNETLEVVLLEKLLYSFYLGDYAQIAELTQNFTSQQLQTKHIFLLNSFCEYGHRENFPSTCKKVNVMAEVNVQPEKAKAMNQNLLECFLHIRMEVNCLLELKKIDLICQMLKKDISKEAIKKLIDTDSQYLDIVNRFIHKTSMEIYMRLIQDGCVKPEVANKIDYEKLDYFDSQILQILQCYFDAK